MADATLNDVIARLRADNERQLREQGDTTKAVENLSGTIRGLLDYLELQGLRQKEAEAEARRRAVADERNASAAAARAEGMELGFGGLGSMFGGIIGTVATFVTGIGSFAAGLVLATEGLGPSLANFRFFVSNVARIFTLPARFIDDLRVRTFGGLTFAQYISNQFNAIGKLFQRFEFDPRSNRWRNITTGRFGTPGYIQQIVNRFTKFGESVKPFLNFLSDNKIVNSVFRFLRPVAVIFSMFDGLRNAAAEMEDREDTFDRLIGGGIGGFISGTLGSFFGEFANLLIDLPLWLIKQIVPAQWLNEDGTFKRGSEGGNWFTSLLDGIDTVDFNTLIKEIVQAPFDAVGGAMAFVRNLFGATGTTEEGQAAAREAWNTWWGNWTGERGLSGIASNIGGIFRVLSNIVFSPVNAIMNQIERAFTGDITAGEGESFTDKITRYVTQLGEWIFNLLPSVDSIKASVARSLGPGAIVDFLGLNEYLPIASTADAERILGGSIERLQDITDRITGLETQLENTGDDYLAASFLAEQLDIRRRELADAEAETAALLATARGSSAVSPTVVNNFQQQYETFQFPGNGAVDGNDSLRVFGGGR
jgi:hypothetical protein